MKSKSVLSREHSFHLPNIVDEMLPKGYEFLPGASQVYELELALGELRSLSRSQLIKRSAYFYKVDGDETHHYRLCSGGPLLGSEAYGLRRDFFRVYQFKTGYATHGLFPYRGKFHPQLIKAIMNVMQLRKGEVVLDPMTGSGTTNVEASTIGLDSIGVDTNPFCVLMAQAKIDALNLRLEDLKSYIKDPKDIFEYFHQRSARQALFSRSQTEVEPDFAKNDALESLFLLCYLDAVGYARRRKKKDVEDVFPQVFDRYVIVVTNFIKARDELKLKLGNAIITKGDARNLKRLDSERLKKIEDGSVDGIITSPPYSFAIDYLDEDRPQLEYLGYNVKGLKERMIGLRGETLKEKIYAYLPDMDRVVDEMSRVLADGKYCVVILGSNTVQINRALNGLGINLEEKLIESGKKHNLTLRRRVLRPIEGMRNVMKTESILFFQK